jgi:16S rRNA (adenine1518-N6/adenine1519-N6)-dimethyltransferase
VNDRSRIGRADARRLLAENDIEASRALGQNFVVDPNTVDRIVRMARVGPGDTVVEIGAGLGSLTLALAESGADVTAIEIDRRLLPLLRDLVGARAKVLEGDAMTLDWSEIVDDQANTIVVSNLPYNIATPLVVTLLEKVAGIARFVVMVQKEVADRMAAPPGNKTYGAVSIRIAYFATAKVLGTVSPEVFVPRPRVLSAIVEITRRDEPAIDPEVATYREIDTLVRAGFGGRRKMLRRSLAGLVDDATFAAAGVDPMARPEELGIDRWGTLAACRRKSGLSPS